ncbi:MAG: hypothetical protein SNJ71_00395 [Bacteroidales bacterium]
MSEEKEFIEKTNAAVIEGAASVSLGHDRYRNILPDISVRAPYSRESYYSFRPNERLPEDHYEAVRACKAAYRNIGLIRNVIDLMSEFTIKGIHLNHENSTIQKFYREWWERVDGFNRSEKFVSYLLRTGMCAVFRSTAKLNDSNIKLLKTGRANNNPQHIQPSEFFLGENVIPWKYIFLDPTVIHVYGGDLTQLSESSPRYYYSYPDNLFKILSDNVRNKDECEIRDIPDYILNAIRRGERKIPLPPDSFTVYHYKKDDCDVWADSIIYPILTDLMMYEKMKLADVAALDGIIGRVRVWKLGSLEHRVPPNPKAMAKLSEILSANVGGGSFDLIWSEDIKVEETSTEVSKILNFQKYEAVLSSIYSGLGIPPTLTGTFKNPGGFTNNSISIQTLLERLNYIRSVLVEFWTKEILLVAKSMNFNKPAKIAFSLSNLLNKDAELRFYLQLVDRNIMPIETFHELLGQCPSLELSRMKKQIKNIKNKSSNYYPMRLGPYPDPTINFEEKPNLNSDTKENKNKIGQSGEGRPPQSKDREKRTRKPKPIGSGVSGLNSLFREAQSNLKKIDKILLPLLSLLDIEKNKKDSNKTINSSEVEELKFILLCNCFNCNGHNIVPDEDFVKNIICNGNLFDINPFIEIYDNLLKSFSGKKLNKKKKREIQCLAYAICGVNYENKSL